MLTTLPEMPVYAQLPLKLVKGDGVFVYDENGTRFLDMYGGHAVAASGHCHPKVVAAICAQAKELIFYSNAVDVSFRRELCTALIRLGPEKMAGVFLCNSGAEANENALALARQATNRSKVVTVEGGFHGRTLLTLSICGIEKYRALTQIEGRAVYDDFEILPFADESVIEKMVDETCAAVLVEPVQGLAGARCVPFPFLKALSQRCENVGAKLIFDEVQCGTGRCGAFTAGQAVGVTPHMVTLAKGLGGGFPIGAVLANDEICANVKSGQLGSTFGGGPLACAAAVTNLEAIEEECMIENAAEMGKYLKDELEQLPGVIRVQGAGLLIGVVFDRPANAVTGALFADHKILAGTSAEANTLRIMPPLNMNKTHGKTFISAMKEILMKGNL